MGRAAGLETHTSNPWAAGHAEALLHVGNRVECCRAAGLRCSRLLGLLELGCTRGRYGGGPTCDPLKSENHPTTQYFAITAAWAGEKELALQQLEAGLRAPNASLMLSYGALNCSRSGTRSAAIRTSKKSSPRSRQKTPRRQRSETPTLKNAFHHSTALE